MTAFDLSNFDFSKYKLIYTSETIGSMYESFICCSELTQNINNATLTTGTGISANTFKNLIVFSDNGIQAMNYINSTYTKVDAKIFKSGIYTSRSNSGAVNPIPMYIIRRATSSNVWEDKKYLTFGNSFNTDSALNMINIFGLK